MTVKEAAAQLGYTDSAVCHICRQGGFPGAQRVGQKVWLIPVEEAAKRLNMSHRSVRYLCSKGRIAGAHVENDDWMIPLATLKSIKIYNEGLAD